MIILMVKNVIKISQARQSSAVGDMSDGRYASDGRSRDRKFDRGLVPYFCGD